MTSTREERKGIRRVRVWKDGEAVSRHYLVESTGETFNFKAKDRESRLSALARAFESRDGKKGA